MSMFDSIPAPGGVSAPSAVDPRFQVDLESLHDMKSKLAQLPAWYLEQAQTKLSLRQRKMDVSIARDRNKAEYKATRDRAYVDAKKSAEKVTNDAAQAMADQDPRVVMAAQMLVPFDKEMESLQVQYDFSVDVMDALRLLHRSLTTLVGDIQDERRFS